MFEMIAITCIVLGLIILLSMYYQIWDIPSNEVEMRAIGKISIAAALIIVGTVILVHSLMFPFLR